ncbi:MAG: carbohydrate-binding family 9-like protein [Polyangiaceae bacterium]
MRVFLCHEILARRVVLLSLVAASACSRSTDRLGPTVDRSGGDLPTLSVPRTDSAPVIDGDLTDEAWQRAASTGPFVSPASGKPTPGSKVRARARLLYDASHLFIAFEVLDEAPVSAFRADEEDPHVWSSASGVEMMLAPGDHDDNRDYFEVQIEVGGAVWDTHFDDYNKPIRHLPLSKKKRFGRQEWKSGIERATRRESWGYSVELSLPFAMLRTAREAKAPAAGAVWRMNFYSFRDGQGDALAWSPLLGKGNFHRASRFGRVTFQQ